MRGKIIFQGQDIEDFVICRNNGVPLLNFAVVIDDYLMKISHILRGEEHLSNTAKQLVLYEALNWNPPFFAHLSLILNKEKKKLSKRDEETSQFQMIYQLREKGYLPAAIINYLLLLGWNPKTNQEIFSFFEALENFNLTGLQSQGAVFDVEKLNWYNRHYIQVLKEAEFNERAWKFLSQEYNLGPEKREWVVQVASLFRPRLDYFQKLIDLSRFFFQEPPFSNEPSLSSLKQDLVKLDKWEEESISPLLQKEKKILPLSAEV